MSQYTLTNNASQRTLIGMAEKTKQIGIRLPIEWLEIADVLARRMRTPGMVVTRTDVLRQAMAIGLEQLQKGKKK
jgi:hypothetical protein